MPCTSQGCVDCATTTTKGISGESCSAHCRCEKWGSYHVLLYIRPLAPAHIALDVRNTGTGCSRRQNCPRARNNRRQRGVAVRATIFAVSKAAEHWPWLTSRHQNPVLFGPWIWKVPQAVRHRLALLSALSNCAQDVILVDSEEMSWTLSTGKKNSRQGDGGPRTLVSGQAQQIFFGFLALLLLSTGAAGSSCFFAQGHAMVLCEWLLGDLLAER